MSYDLMFQKAVELHNAGALNEAEAIYLKMLQVMPENSDVWNLLGLIAQARGDEIKAVDCFLNAIKYAPVPFFAHFFNLALSYKALNKNNEAREALDKSVYLKPDFKEGWNTLGVWKALGGALEDGIKDFCKALEIDSDYEEARVNLCFYSKDKAMLFKIADENETSFFANFKAAECAEDMTARERYLKRAVAAAPERSDGLLAMAEFYQQKGDFNVSLIFYHKVLNLNDKDVAALLGAADIYLAQKEFDKAEKYYLKSFEQTRELAGAHLNYGILLYQTGRFTEALEEYRKAAALAPEKPEVSYNLALILKETGDLEEALGLMFNAHIKAPENKTFMVNIAETLAQLFQQNAELALKIAENWQKQEPDNVFSKRLLSGMSGGTADNDITYSEGLFDTFAATFDETIEKLEPKIIEKFKEIHGGVTGRVLDLGCGTGRAAAALKSKDNAFIGVDVSGGMLEVARAKGNYEALYQQDILSFLRSKSPTLNKYDLVVAFDVFCYMGALDEVLKELLGCEVWFSVESADEERGKDYYLMANGRYKHSENYVKKTLESVGFKEINAYPLVLRKENGEDVAGILYQVR
ncbi:MAG: tetratricopeptide repeat protein [Alphaproteobacteria bacterium]|nr:tetratricopeptide repeat protein [Alphaproteobacteria bacterium]